jgi:hypothetical protein
VEALLAAMATHKGSACVHEKACGVLADIANNSDNQVKITAVDGVKALLAAMAAHKGIAMVQQNACVLLANLAKNSDKHSKSRLLRLAAWKQFKQQRRRTREALACRRRCF